MKNKLLPFLWDNVKERKLVVLSLVFLGFIPTIMCGTLADLLLKKVIDGLTLNQITLIRAIIYLSIYTIL
ncbi:MAG: hypothetical protein LBQ13_00200, partial [Endomicrobium sp.]|nr:hypothetical protein [Endomicrobium sp.]